VSLFIGTLVFEDQEFSYQIIIKPGVIIDSLISVLVATTALKLSQTKPTPAKQIQ